MSIKLRAGAWHCDFVAPNGVRIRRSLETSDKRQAQELHDSLKAEAWRANKMNEAPRKTFDEACVRWLREKADKKSLDDDKSRIGFWLIHFRGVYISDINEVMIADAISTMVDRRHLLNWEMKKESCVRQGKPVPEYIPKAVSRATVNTYLAFIRALLNLAVTWKWLEKVPKISTPRPKNKRVRWLTDEESQRLFEEIAPHLFPLVIFALTIGLRRSNVTNMEWSQVDLDRGMA